MNEEKSSYSYNSDFLLKNGKPWFPVMGELHYSRYPKKLWPEALAKMKAGRSDDCLFLYFLDPP